MAIGDMFLRVDSARAGFIKGESIDPQHVDEIEVLEWDWGLRNEQTPGGAERNRATFRELKVTKRVDSASTGLMSALRANDPIKAVLSVRKAGGEQVEFFRIMIDRGRVTALTTQSLERDGVPELVDEVVISFAKVSVEYRGQGPDGQLRGASSFDAEISSAT